MEKAWRRAGGIYQWDVNKGKLIFMTALMDFNKSIQWSPDGTHIVANNGLVNDTIHQVPVYLCWGYPYGEDYQVQTFSPDGKYLATGQERIVLRIPANGSVILALEGAANQPDQLAFSPDSQTLASLSKVDGTVILWKVP